MLGGKMFGFHLCNDQKAIIYQLALDAAVAQEAFREDAVRVSARYQSGSCINLAESMDDVHQKAMSKIHPMNPLAKLQRLPSLEIYTRMYDSLWRYLMFSSTLAMSLSPKST